MEITFSDIISQHNPGAKMQDTIHIYIKCKKHFIKMLKDVGMVVPKIKETRL